MKRSLFLTACFMIMCSCLFGQNWTVNNATYESNMSLLAKINIENADVTGSNYEVAAFYNDEVRAVNRVENGYVSLTIQGRSNEQITFKLYDHSTQQKYATDYKVNFKNNGLIGNTGSETINFHKIYWDFEPDYELNVNMTVTAVILKDGEVQNRSNLEVAAYINGEQRAVAKPVQESDGSYLVDLFVCGIDTEEKKDEGEKVTFKIYDFDTETEYDAEYTTIFEDGKIEGLDEPVKMKFITRPYVAQIGEEKYQSLKEAIGAADGKTVTMLEDIELAETITVEAGKTVTLNLNGKTITGTDNATGSFGLITNRGNLTVTGNGTITLTATNNRGWNAYSSVISNNPGGKLVVENGTIEHLGGTDMAYAIDNLTNGKGTYAETVVNDGTVKSPYRAIRQFLNGVEAQNILTVNGGTIEGGNKSIWMQDPSANANSGKLTVVADASLKGDAYLSVTAGSTEWPVEVSIASAALKDGSEVLTNNVPATYAVEKVENVWGVYDAVATVNGVGYTTVTKAINAAQDGATVQLLAGTINEVIKPWAADSQHTSEKSITIVGAENFGTTLTGGLYLGYDDSGCRAHTITIKGIAFEGKGVLVAGQQEVIIEGNKFTNITELVATRQSATENAISVIGKNVTATVTGNIIDGTNESGIHLRDVKNATVTNNTVANTKGSSITINPTTGSNGEITVENNTLSNWGLSDEGRAMRISGGATVKVNGNVMSNTNAPEEFVKITGATTVDASKNYWNGVSPLSMFNTDLAKDPVEILVNYYTDVAKNNLVDIEASVAKVGNKYYQSLTDAFAAVENGGTVTLVADFSVDTETVTIADGKAVVLDMNGKKITVTDKATSNYELFYIYGELTVTGNGTIELTSENNRGWNASSSIFHNRGGVLTVENGTFTHKGGTDMAYVIDNSGNYYGNATTNVNANLTSSYIAIRNRMEQNTHGASGKAILNVAGGQISGERRAIWAQAASTSTTAPATGEINVSGGTIGLIETACSEGAESMTTITGGTVAAFKGEAGELEVQGGTITGNITIMTAAGVEVPYAITSEGLYVEAVAQIGTTNYATLQEAVNVGGEVKVLTNITLAETVEVTAGKTVTLDLNGKTITTTYDESAKKHLYAVNNYGDLTIKSSVEGGKIAARGNYNYGKLTLESGTIDACDGNGGYAVFNQNGSEFVMNGGAVKASFEDGDAPGNGFDATTIRVESGAKATITAGTITNNSNYTYAIDNAGEVTISGGTVTSIHSTVSNYGTMTINGGLFTCNGLEGITAHALVAWDGSTTTINGGKFDGKDNYNGFNVDAVAGANVEITGGEFLRVHSGSLYGDGTILVSGGTFFDVVDEARLAEGYACIAENDKFTVYPNGGKIAYRAYITDNANREAVGVDLNNVCAGKSLVVELYDAAGNLLTTTSLKQGGVKAENYTCNIVLWGNPSSSWTTTINAEQLTVDNIPATIKLYVDGILVDTFENALGAGTNVDETADYIALDCVYKEAKIGNTYYTSLAAAFEAAEDDDVIIVVNDIALAESITNTKKVTLDLNGKTITGTDNATGSFGLFTNRGELTITGNGTITLTATNNRGWNAYSSVISNTVGGKLVVENGTIEHLGGTDMAYAIDNLTNGKGTYAETVVNGGTVKSTYRAIRQFLNGIEAQNILTVKGGTIEGANKSIWMQDPSKNANTGTLTVDENAVLNGDVYLFVTAGSTEWPVEVAIASAALKNGAQVLTGNVPETYVVKEVNGTWGVFRAVAKIGETSYQTLAEAVAAAQNGETITMLADVTLTESVTVAAVKTIVLDLNGKTISPANDKVNLDIYGKLTINDETGNGVSTFRNHFVHANAEIVVNGGTIQNIESAAGGFPITLSEENAKATINGGTVQAVNGEAGVRNGNYAITVGSTSSVTVNGGTINGDWGGINSAGTVVINNGIFNVTDAIGGHCVYAYAGTVTIKDGIYTPNTVASSYSVFVEETAAVEIIGGIFHGGQTNNSCVIGVTNGSNATIAVSGGTFDKDVTAFCALGYICTQNTDGTYTVKDDPSTLYITNLDELIEFRDDVNAGNDYAGITVYLAADIDMAGIDWSVNIGDDCSATFDGTFDGQGHKLMNLTSTETAQKGDGYICTGLFGAIHGNAVLKNFTIENVTINTGDYTGNNVSAVVGFAYNVTGSIENVKVTGSININAPKATGVGAIIGYDYYSPALTVNNCVVAGNAGSTILGKSYVGGAVGYASNKIALNENTVENVSVTATGSVGAIAGIMLTGGSADANIVKNVALVATGELWANSAAVVAGTITSTGAVTVANTTVENVTANGVAASLVGGKLVEKPTTPIEKVEARIGNKYYATLEGALVAEGNEVTLLVPYVVEAGETVVLDLNGKTVTGTPTEAKAYAVITNNGNLTIKNGPNKNGSIVCNHTLAGSTGYAVNTITNCGTLTIDGATISNTSTVTNQIGYAIDNNSTTGNAVVVVKSGAVRASGSNYYDGIRQFCNSLTNENDVTIEGGEVSTLWMQNPSDGAEKNTKDVKGSFSITGGKVGVVSTEPSANFTASITAGEITSVGHFQTADGRDLVGFITGGTFGMDVTDPFCAENYSAVPNYDNDTCVWIVKLTSGTLTRYLAEGWNWFSSFIDIEGPTGLGMLESALNPSGIQIKDNASQKYVNYSSGNWRGSLTATSSTKMYAIKTSAEHTLNISGNIYDANDYNVELHEKWNYLSYPLYESKSLETAFRGFAPANGDQIKTIGKTAVYNAALGKWLGSFPLEPGVGYMYYSNEDGKDFSYSTEETRSSAVSYVSKPTEYWIVNESQYPNNMTMIATLDVEGTNYEVAAFVDGELRGSARPIYVEELDQCIILMTISGENVGNITFKYYDHYTSEEYTLNNVAVYSNNAILGSVDAPYALTRGTTGIGENSLNDINIYPNPTTTDREINLQATCDKVEVFNTLGVKVAEYQNVDSIDALETAGTYVIRLTLNGDVKHCRLIVR